jgi:hypothetical protein
VKYRWLRWVWQKARMVGTKAFLRGNLFHKQTLGWPTVCEDNINIDGGFEDERWMELAEDRIHRAELSPRVLIPDSEIDLCCGFLQLTQGYSLLCLSGYFLLNTLHPETSLCQNVIRNSALFPNITTASSFLCPGFVRWPGMACTLVLCFSLSYAFPYSEDLYQTMQQATWSNKR